MTDRYDQQRRAAHDTFSHGGSSRHQRYSTPCLKHQCIGALVTATEVFTWAGTLRVGDPAKVNVRRKQRAIPRASDADCDKMEQATRQHVSVAMKICNGDCTQRRARGISEARGRVYAPPALP
jgi:hypothetical protein